MTLKNQEWKVYLAATHSQDYDVARMGWSGDYNDPNTFLDMWITGGGNNRTGWSNPAYDSLIAQASLCLDQARRFALFKKRSISFLSNCRSFRFISIRTIF